jgi:outer membrane receptor protein involved in Fe transport
LPARDHALKTDADYKQQRGTFGMIIGRFKLRRGRQVLIAALLGGTLLSPVAAQAQSAAAQDQSGGAPAAQNDASDAATIIVTAKNRKEKLQGVPLSITAFDNAALQSAGITDARDVAQFTPSFNFYSGTGRSDPTALAIRGLASNTSDERY